MRKLKIPYECASNGQEAFDIFCAAPTEFKLVIMDLDMPILDGHGSSRKIRDFERRHHLPRTFIVALTGVTSAEVKNASVRSGMDRFHSKPILMKDLSILIAEVSGEGKRTGS